MERPRHLLLLAAPLLTSALKVKLGGLAPPPPAKTHFDLIVIGGGSGGLAASKAAANLGKSVAVFDFVKPSPQGTTWGLGGTCVNVGCIPKKLMHQAAQLGEARADSAYYGWEIAEEEHDWETMVAGVQNYVKSMNFAYRTQCMTNDVTYIDAFATFVDTHKLEATTKAGATTEYTADQFVVCTGGRPRYLDIPGAKEHCITSDDLFSLAAPPGKTLVVGASYVALECAGFLHGLGFETTVLVRSVPLRGFDAQMAGLVVDHMRELGVEFVEGATPTSVERLDDGRKRVVWRGADGAEASAEFDTVLLAVGRDAFTHKLGLDKVGVDVNPKSGKLPVQDETTNAPHVFAIGDVVDGEALDPPSALTELTPVAIQAGRLLASRLFVDGFEGKMDYGLVPTTVYTPIEYGSCGLAEEDAIAKLGEKNVEVYHSYFKPLEWTVPHRGDNACYAKIICDLTDSERVIGLHVCGPNAGEMTQGFAVAMRCGATKADFTNTVGIHPTTAEEFTILSVSKRSGDSAEKAGC